MIDSLEYKVIVAKRAFFAFSLVSLALFFWPVTTMAFFGDQESSEENIMSASSLGIDLSLVSQDSDSRLVEISANQAENPEYRLLNASSTGAFCLDVQMEITRGGNNVYSGALATFTGTASSTLPSGDNEDWGFEFSVSNTNAIYVGECSIIFAFEANQNGYDFGEAFFDRETDSFVLYGSDFSSPLSTGVVLNEVLPNPEGLDTQGGLQGEWVEVYNNGNTPVDLTGWYIEDLAGNKVFFSASTTMNGQTIVDVPGSGNEWVVLFMGGAVLNNDSAETVYLYDNNGVLKDQYSYGTNTNTNDADSDSNHTGGGDNDGPTGSETANNEGKSDARIPDGIGIWIDPEPTAGTTNYVTEEMLREVGYSESMIEVIMIRQEEAKERYRQLQREYEATQADPVLMGPALPPTEVETPSVDGDVLEVVEDQGGDETLPAPVETDDQAPETVQEGEGEPNPLADDSVDEVQVVPEEESTPEDEPEPEPEPESVTEESAGSEESNGTE